MTSASSGNGSSPHLAGELLKYLTGVDITHVPFRGGAASGAKIIAGRIDLLIDNVPRFGTRTQPASARRWKQIWRMGPGGACCWAEAGIKLSDWLAIGAG
ncbi:MAG: hypothetical protein JHC89_07310 [Acetobacteraceae bacterium]|jgi:hypothetical protein|nr:hypothetical protein [Acetobacteraceae bacterium]